MSRLAALTVVIWALAGGEGSLVRAFANGGRGADHRLPVRDGPGRAHGGDGGHRARRGAGLLIKGGEALQRAADVTAVVFDKTGTLTVGRPTVVAVRPAPGIDETALLGWAAAVESHSEHPLAAAIVGRGARPRRDRESTRPASHAEPGLGAAALVDGRAKCASAGPSSPRTPAPARPRRPPATESHRSRAAVDGAPARSSVADPLRAESARGHRAGARPGSHAGDADRRSAWRRRRESRGRLGIDQRGGRGAARRQR